MDRYGLWPWGCAVALACSISVSVLRAEQSNADAVRDVIQASGRSAGILVIAGVSDDSLGAELSRRTDFLVHGLALNEEALGRLRQADGPNAEGGGVFLDALRERQLPYADNLINVLVVSDLPSLAGCGIAWEELMRVVAPEGCLLIEGTSAEEVNGKLVPKGSATCKQLGRFAVVVKPWPAEMDVWSHPWHSASGNRASADTLVEAAQGMRWLAGPSWPKADRGGVSRAVVTNRGRIFYLTQGNLENLSLTEDAASWYLVARDAFNGQFLWQHKYIPFKQGFAFAQEMEHILVADRDRIYLGNSQNKNESMEILDAATGKILSTFRLPRLAQKVFLDGGRLIVSCGRNGIHALDPDTGESLWAAPNSSNCVMGGGGIFCLDKEQVSRLDSGDGRRTWATALSTLDAPESGGWKLHFVHDGLVLLSKGGSSAKYPLAPPYGGELHALAAEDGKKLWSFPIPASVYETRYGIEAFAVNKKIWTFVGGEKKGAGNPVLYALHPQTGQLQQTVQTSGSLSPGCGQLTATPRYFLGTRPAVSMFEVKSERNFLFRAARGSCKHPIVPANGLVYVSPNTCICRSVVNTSLRGFLAMGGSSAARPPSDAPRRIAAPSSQVISKAAVDDWPTLRGGPERSGRAATSIPADPDLVWQRALAQRRETGTLSKDWNTNSWLGDPISGPVVAGGLVFVALPNEHAVVALSAVDGKPHWRFTAGGPVDSPPTIQDGLCVFGCRDGWVYCLRAEDGKMAWRYRVAPREVRIAAFGNLESPWPVSGSLLVQQGLVCAIAGRSTESDGGAQVTALKLHTGELVWERQLSPEGELEGVVNSVMVGDGESAYLGPWGFRLASGDPAEGAALLTGVRGILDGAWRRLPASTRGKMHDWEFKGNRSLYLVYDDARVYNYFSEMTDKENSWTSILSSKVVAQKQGANVRKSPEWTLEILAPAQVESMILSNRLLVLAGTEDFVSHRGAFVSLVSTDTGKVLKKFSMDAPPAWEGMAAAGGRLFISGIDGVLRCYGKK